MKISKIGCFFAICSIVVTSCHKTVTPRKLDGDWTLTSSTNTSISTYTSGTVSTTTTVNDGSNTVETSDGDTLSYASSSTFSFDKKAGTFVQVVNESRPTTTTVTYYNKIGSDYYPVGTYTQKDNPSAVSTEYGTFTITGGTGDIEKNTQIALITNSYTGVITHNYTYFDGSVQVTDFSNKYIETYNSNNQYEAMKSTVTRNGSSTGVNIDFTVLTVTELKKGVMDLKWERNDSDGSTSYSNSEVMKLTKK